MDFSRLRTRRGVLAMSLAAALSRVVPVRAQLNSGCEYGITNGLISIGGAECDLAVPQHMVDGTSDASTDADGTVGSTTESPKEIRQERLQRRRDHKRTKRGRRTQKQQDQVDRRVAQRILCSDFSSQLDAVEAMSHSPSEAWRLDPDGDGIPCEELTPLTCRSLGTEAEAATWFKKMGYTPDYDPFKLWDADSQGVCTRRVTCDDFSSQKQAVEWITLHPEDKERLVKGNKNMPCPSLPTVTCGSFGSEKEATNWFHQNGFVEGGEDPYKLYDDVRKRVCPEVTCADFSNQKEAIDWATDHPADKSRLDPNGDGLACPKLLKVTCSQFDSSAEVNSWHTRNKLSNDPFGLYDSAADRYCSSLPPKTDG